MIENKDIIVIDWNSLALTVGMGIWNYQKELVPTVISSSIVNRVKAISNEFDMNDASVIIGMDSAPYWRQKLVFEHYKQHRKLNKDKSDFPFDKFFAISNSMLEIMNTGTAMRVVNEQGVEADDVCAMAAKIAKRRLLVISSDHDVTQVCHQYPEKQIAQYSLRRKGLIDPNEYSRADHVLKGDSGDGIPAYNQVDDIFVNPPEVTVRRKSITATMLKYYDTHGHDKFKDAYCTSQVERDRVDRNRKLVCFDYIPEDIQNRVITAINNGGSGVKTPTFSRMYSNAPVPVFLN